MAAIGSNWHPSTRSSPAAASLLMGPIPSPISAIMGAKYINLPQVKDTNNKRFVEARARHPTEDEETN